MTALVLTDSGMPDPAREQRPPNSNIILQNQKDLWARKLSEGESMSDTCSKAEWLQHSNYNKSL